MNRKWFVPSTIWIVVMAIIFVVSLPDSIIRIAQDPASGIGYTIGKGLGLYFVWFFGKWLWRWLGNLGMEKNHKE